MAIRKGCAKRVLVSSSDQCASPKDVIEAHRKVGADLERVRDAYIAFKAALAQMHEVVKVECTFDRTCGGGLKVCIEPSPFNLALVKSYEDADNDGVLRPKLLRAVKLGDGKHESCIDPALRAFDAIAL